MAATTPDGAEAHITCNQILTVDLELHVRHGNSLVLRNTVWYVTEQHITEPLLGRPVLEALGLDTRKILSAAADKFSGEVDVSSLMQQSSPGGTIA